MASAGDTITPAAAAAPATTTTVSCRRCQARFEPVPDRPRDACRFHRESHSGETAQRWLPPGVTAGGGDILYFWSCCGAHDREAPGCVTLPHCSYDEEDDHLW